ncbi:DUF4402 domain-containing protein [Novosphingobium cyanobacteriorum]|uniref:DUF4402 domain-containing protein n=1 Tax=Novosphingobium cyanobacteriorum TaxID=3024215 RepID=A0ABT6CLF2_9SPHN|nr:DUF4402 domain-containing protein [Novosphingobium cyanobacteriorum]MDF8334621.1 DUF4402 domain-containing protein [Novosphingobium cyanobacteriorum]
MRRIGALAALIPALWSAQAFAAGHAASAAGQAQAEVVAPLVMTRLSDLDFGAIFAPVAAGSVTISTDGRASYAGGALAACAGAACSAVHAAAFAVRGEAGRSYAITLPARVTASAEAGAGVLTVESLTVRSRNSGANDGHGLIDAQGEDGFAVGGTLVVPAGLGAGHYRATVDVTITYG